MAAGAEVGGRGGGAAALLLCGCCCRPRLPWPCWPDSWLPSPPWMPWSVGGGSCDYCEHAPGFSVQQQWSGSAWRHGVSACPLWPRRPLPVPHRLAGPGERGVGALPGCLGRPAPPSTPPFMPSAATPHLLQSPGGSGGTSAQPQELPPKFHGIQGGKGRRRQQQQPTPADSCTVSACTTGQSQKRGGLAAAAGADPWTWAQVYTINRQAPQHLFAGGSSKGEHAQ